MSGVDFAWWGRKGSDLNKKNETVAHLYGYGSSGLLLANWLRLGSRGRDQLEYVEKPQRQSNVTNNIQIKQHTCVDVFSLGNSQENDTPLPIPRPKDGRKHRRKLSATLRNTILAGFVATFCVLLLNLLLFIWAEASGTRNNDFITVYQGSCSKTKKIELGWAFAINILSTILLSASNNCAQLLISPTRAEIDVAHSKGKWLQIGVPGISNLRAIGRGRSLLWFCLLFSSVPLHLLWNSALFSTIADNEYLAVLVTPDFVNGGYYNQTYAEMMLSWEGTYQSGDLDIVSSLQDNIKSLQLLNNADCIRAYSTDDFQSDWSNVLVVTDLSLGHNLLTAWRHSAQKDSDSNWMCGDHFDNPCNTKAMVKNSATWGIPSIFTCAYFEESSESTNTTYNNSDYTCVDRSADMSASVSYCLAQSASKTCSTEVSPLLLGIVIFCNCLKLLGIFLALRLGNFEPLATIGDAIASFLATPDDKTKDLGPIGVDNLPSSAVWRETSRSQIRISKPWPCQRRFWYASSSLTTWIIFSILLIVALVAAMIFLFHIGLGYLPSWSRLTSLGFGIGRGTSKVLFSSERTLTANLLLANASQLVISLLYFLYNILLTSMLLCNETSNFADVQRGRKSLRTSFPKLGQRCAYYLQLPFRYAIPMMVAMGFLHFFVSRCVYFVRVNVYNTSATLDQGEAVHGCSWSPAAVLAAIVLGGTMLILLYGIGLRRYNPGIPIMGSCSMAISAACHPLEEENDAHVNPVAYGVLQSKDGERPRVGFSSMEVQPLQAGVVYS